MPLRGFGSAVRNARDTPQSPLHREPGRSGTLLEIEGGNGFQRAVRLLPERGRDLDHLLRQRTHFLRHDRKPTALIAGPGGFHNGVQRQQVGLKGDGVDDTQDVPDPARCHLDVLHRAHDLQHHVPSALGHLRSLLGELIGLRGVVRILLNGGGQRFHRFRRLLETGRVIVRVRGQFFIGLRDLVGAGDDPVDTQARAAPDMASPMRWQSDSLANGLGLVPGQFALAEVANVCSLPERLDSQVKGRLSRLSLGSDGLIGTPELRQPDPALLLPLVGDAPRETEETAAAVAAPRWAPSFTDQLRGGGDRLPLAARASIHSGI